MSKTGVVRFRQRMEWASVNTASFINSSSNQQISIEYLISLWYLKDNT